jgi:hypothetical protein
VPECASDTQRVWGRARAQKRLPVEVRQQLLEAIYAGEPFRMVLRDLGLTSNRVFGLTRTDQEWSEKLDAALTAARREDLQHGTNAAYLHGCVCKDCRTYQLVRMGRNRGCTPICPSARVLPGQRAVVGRLHRVGWASGPASPGYVHPTRVDRVLAGGTRWRCIGAPFRRVVEADVGENRFAQISARKVRPSQIG